MNRVLSLVVIFSLACTSSKSGGAGGAGGDEEGSGGSGTGGSTGGSSGKTGGSGGAAAGAGGGGATGTGGTPATGGAPGPDAGAADVPSAGPSVACMQMIQAANAFIAGIMGEAPKRSMALLPFAMRQHFKYTPGTRPGLPLRSMTMEQRNQAMALVKTGLSDAGMTKAENIRKLELVLRAMEGSNTRDPDSYFLAIYGTPGADTDWAWHWEGHHLSLHYSLSKCVGLASVPAFFGTNPAEVGMMVAGGPPMGTRVLGKEEDLARELATLLNADAQKRAMAIVAGQEREVPDSPAEATPRTPAGLAVSSMNAAEAAKLKEVINEYASAMAPELAMIRMKRLEDAGFDKITFLWSGSLMRNQAHYYRVQGPTFLIEFLNQQNNANHVHSAWRDFDGDFGVDVIKLHLQQVRH